MCRRQVIAEIDIDAPIGVVYAIATNVEQVARYEPEIERIDVVDETPGQERLVDVRFRVLGVRLRQRYRHALRPPRLYAGVRTGGWLRGWFTMRFKSVMGGTRVTHAEGFRSPIPGLAFLAGFIYFSLLSPGGVRGELRRLRDLVQGDDANHLALQG